MGIHGSSSSLRGPSPSLPSVSKLIWDSAALGWLKSVLPLAMESLNPPPPPKSAGPQDVTLLLGTSLILFVFRRQLASL